MEPEGSFRVHKSPPMEDIGRVLFPSGFPAKIFMRFPSVSYVLHDLSISSSVIDVTLFIIDERYAFCSFLHSICFSSAKGNNRKQTKFTKRRKKKEEEEEESLCCFGRSVCQLLMHL